MEPIPLSLLCFTPNPKYIAPPTTSTPNTSNRGKTFCSYQKTKKDVIVKGRGLSLTRDTPNWAIIVMLQSRAIHGRNGINGQRKSSVSTGLSTAAGNERYSNIVKMMNGTMQKGNAYSGHLIVYANIILE